MTKPKFEIGQEVLADVCDMMPGRRILQKMTIKRRTVEKIETESTGETNIIYRCEVEDKWRTKIDPLIERNWYGKAKESYVHTFDMDERNLYTKEEALEEFKQWLGVSDEQ